MTAAAPRRAQMSSMGSVATSSASPAAAPSVAVSSMAAAGMPPAPVSPAVAPPPPTSSPARGHHHPPHQHAAGVAVSAGGAVQTHSGHLGGVWGQAMRGSPDSAAGQYTSPAPAHGHLAAAAAHHARFAFQVRTCLYAVGVRGCERGEVQDFWASCVGCGFIFALTLDTRRNLKEHIPFL